MSSILVFGRDGQVATELQRLGDVVALGRDQADLTDPSTCSAAIHAYRPKAVINAAAYTAVDDAEENEALATKINSEAPATMAQTCAELKIPFVHISTDYVFAGDGTKAWLTNDTPAPQNAYGRSKLAGELAVIPSNGCNAVLRTSWVFSAHGNNFVKTMLRLSQTRDSLNIVADQIGGPTSARAIAQACLNIADQLGKDQAKSGIYHFSGKPDVSWCEFAQTVFSCAKLDVTVHPIATSDFPTRAMRPQNSRMDCQLTHQVFGMPRPDWRADLQEVIFELEQQK